MKVFRTLSFKVHVCITSVVDLKKTTKTKPAGVLRKNKVDSNLPFSKIVYVSLQIHVCCPASHKTLCFYRMS